MSFSKVSQNCDFCQIGRGIYNCPRCNRKYCSTHCYKCRAHQSCSESFYQEWVQTSLREKNSDQSEKEQMLRMLQKFEEESAGATSGEATFEERFANLDLKNADETQVWQAMSEEEKAGFQAFISDEKNLESILSVKQPWWTSKNLNLVSEINSDDEDRLKDEIAARPPFPLTTRTLLELSSTKPSDCIQYNLTNVLYTYSFLYRFYNCDLRDFLENVVDSIFSLTPVLSEGRNYFNLQESIQDSIRLISDSDFNTPFTFVKSIINDVVNILQGPNNARSSTFVVCALQDIKLLFLELKYISCKKKEMDKELKKKLLLSVKKIEYLISWSLEYESSLSEIASDLVLIMLPDLIPDSIPMPHIEIVKNEKVLIEELE